MRSVLRGCCVTACLVAIAAVPAWAGEFKFRVQEVETGLGVGYAVRLLDMNGDEKPDIVVVDQDRLLWYENPGWERHVFAEGVTKPDNVCFAPYDIDGDGDLDFALGADWQFNNTTGGGTLQWIENSGEKAGKWQAIAIGNEPTLHRIRWADTDGEGRQELVVAPLKGRNTTSEKNFSENPVRLLAYSIPDDPKRDRWPAEVLNADLHVVHNFWPTDLDEDGRTDILVASYEGVSLLERDKAGTWRRTLLGTGNQETSPRRGASEVKHGRLSGGEDYIATIEPWHGHQVVVYTPPKQQAQTLWLRHLLDEQLKWGHAVWPANLDEDEDEELIIGVRDHLDDEWRSGVRIYDPKDASAGKWERTIVDPGGVNIEDLAAGDLDGDGKVDIVAVGRQSKNIRVYWNEGK